MTVATAPINPLSTPTNLAISGSSTLSVSARYLVLGTASNTGYTLTISSSKSHLVRNVGSNSFTVAVTGASSTLLDTGDELRVSWDPSAAAHKIAKNPAPDTAMSDSSTDPPRNSVVKAYIDAQVATTQNVMAVDTLDDLRALTTAPDMVFVSGHTAVKDGGGGTFMWLSSTGSASDDDDGWHVVSNAGSPGAKNVWGRLSTVVTPQMFGGRSALTTALAKIEVDQADKFQTAVDFWANPHAFAGTAKWNAFREPLRFEAPPGFYNCQSTIVVDPPGTPSGYEYQDLYVPGEFVMHGFIFTPFASNIPAIRLQSPRTAAKPRYVFRAYKDRHDSTLRLAWDYGTYPTRYVDDTALRTFAASTKYFRDEEIVYKISGVKYVFLCTLTGTSHASTVPSDVSGTEFDNGTAKFKCSGTARIVHSYDTAKDGKSMNDVLADNRDIGIQIDNCWEHDQIHVTALNYCVGLACYPREGIWSAVGWATIHAAQIQGCMVGVLVATYLGERMMAAGGRLTLCDFPIGGMVWETTYPASPTDAGTKYRFNGPAGTEATSGNWSTDSTWASKLGGSPTWVNDCTFNLHLMAPYWQGTGIITGNKSQYGIVFTSFGPAYAVNNHKVNGLALENNPFSKTVLNESTQVLFYTGAGNQVHCRNEDPLKTATVLVAQKNYLSEQPRLNRVSTNFAGKTAQATSQRLSRLGGYGNVLVDAPFEEGTIAEETIMFTDRLTFSSFDTVVGRNMTWVHRTSTNQMDYRDYAPHRYSGETNGPMYHLADDTWSISSYYLPTVMIDLTDDDMNAAVIRLDVMLSKDTTLSTSLRYFNWLGYALETDGITKIDPTKWTTSPVRYVKFQGNYFAPTTSATYYWSFGTYDGGSTTITIPTTVIMGVAPGIKKLALGVYGGHMRGFRVQVIGAGSASIYSPYHDRAAGDRDVLTIDAVPEKGFIKPPWTAWYRDETGTYQLARLNKAMGTYRYHATTGEYDVFTPQPTTGYQWGYKGSQGSATIYEWDGDSWESIATNAYYTVPGDFNLYSM